MIRNLTIILCLLCLLLVTSCHSPVTDPLDSGVEPFENAQVVLPSDGEIAIRWVIPPLDHDAIGKSRRNRRNLKFLVGPEGTPWIGYNDTYLMNPVKQVWVEVLKGYQDLTQLENGAIVISKPTEFGFMVAAKRHKARSAPLVAVQPISQLPIPNCRMFRGEDNCLYFSGLNKSTSQNEVYLLKPENVFVAGQKKKTLTGYKQIFSGPKTINAVSGDGNTTYIAIENTILSIRPDVKACETIFVHPSKSITQLQYNTQSGLFYSTNDKIGYVGENGHLEFFSRARTQMSLNKTTLYVFSEDDFGVLAFDHIDDLSRRNLHINKMVPNTKREKPEVFAQLGHLNGISAVAFSPDGKYVISSDKRFFENALVIISDSITGKEIRTFEGPKSGADFVSMSPDNKYALALNEDHLKAWDLSKETDSLIISLRKDDKDIIGELKWAAFSPDGKTISVLSEGDTRARSSTLDIWEISSRLKIKTVKGFTEINKLTPRNKYLFKDWVIYDAITSEPIKRLKEVEFVTDEGWDDNRSNLFAFSDGCARAALGNFFYDTLVLRDFDKDTRSVIKTTGKLLKVDISRNGKFVGAIVDTSPPFENNYEYVFRVWGFNDGKKIINAALQHVSLSLHVGPSSPLAPSPDWNTIVTGFEDGSIRILDMATTKELLSIVAEQDDQKMMAIEFDRYIATAPDKAWVIWDVREGVLVDLANLTKDRLMSYFSKNSLNEEKTVQMASNSTSSDQNHHAKVFNGTVKLFESKTDKEIAQFITYRDGEWIIITPEGYYNASPNGAKYLTARIGHRVYGIGNYSDTFFRPDLVKAALANVCPEQVSDVLSPKLQQEESLEVAKETNYNAER